MAEVNWSLGLAPNYSDAFRYREAGQANRQQQDELQRQAQQRAALTAYARDPQAGLAGVIETDPRLGIALQDQQLQNQQAEQARKLADQERALKAKRAFGEAIVHVPKGNRSAIYDAIGAVIPGLDSQTLEELRPQIDNDEFWRALVGKYDDELKVVAPGGVLTRGGQVVYQAPQREAQPPAGYRATSDGNLAFIPGGPADPRQAGTLAGARRKPGGSGRSGGGGGMKLPAGFVLDGN